MDVARNLLSSNLLGRMVNLIEQMLWPPEVNTRIFPQDLGFRNNSALSPARDPG